jgi:hypothetical protein
MNIKSCIASYSHLSKMPSSLEEKFQKLRLLKEAPPKLRKEILRKCKRSLLHCLCECALNVLKGNVPLKKLHKTKLSRFKHKLRKLASKKTRVKLKKRIVQTGGFIDALLTPVLSFLGTLLSNKL